MEIDGPWIGSARAREVLQKRICALLGERIARPLYLVATGAGDDQQSFLLPGNIDEVSMGIELVTYSEAIFRFTWKMVGINSGLNVGLKEEQTTSFPPRPIDVTNSCKWQSLLGLRVTAVGIAWHQPEAHSQISVWSIRLNFEGKLNLVLALGEMTEGGLPRYMPDAVLAIFDQTTAEGYRIVTSPTSAWGETICELGS